MAIDESAGAASEVAALKRPFLVGLAAAVLLMALLGVVIRQANAGNHRPEGAAERWLAAVGDTTRKGVGADARKRAEEIGSLEAAKGLVPAEGSKATDGKVAFPDLEVGGATVVAGVARVPYRLHERIGGGKEQLREGVVLLKKTGDEWKVTGIDVAKAGEKVPSEGGRIPSRAPFGAFVGAILVGVVITFGAAGLIRWAGR